MEHGQNSWASFRKRTLVVSASVTLLSGVGLFVLFQFEPSSLASERAQETGKLSPSLFAALQTVLATVLSIGVISLLFELLLRESYGRDLLRFLKLRTALVTSGLQNVSLDSTEWKDIFDGAATINARVRDPNIWLIPNFADLLAAAHQHSVDITIGLPDPASKHFSTIAESVSLQDAELHQHIDLAVAHITNQWKAAESRLHRNSKIRVVAYRSIPLFEVITADNRSVCLLTHPVDHQVGDSSLSLVFEQERTQHVSTWLSAGVKGLANCNAIWEGSV